MHSNTSTCGHVYREILGFVYFEDMVWLVALLVTVWTLRSGAERAIESLFVFALLTEVTAAAEMVAIAATFPAHKALRFGARPLAPLLWVCARAALRGWHRAWHWGQTGSPAALLTTVAAFELDWRTLLWLLWAQLVGGWLGVWYMKWVSFPRSEWGFCVPPLQSRSVPWPWLPAAILEGFGAFVEEISRRGLRPPHACSLKMPKLLRGSVHAAAHALASVAAARRTGAIFNPAVAIAGLHVCPLPKAPHVSQYITAYVFGPCLGALLGVAVAPALRCAVQEYLHLRSPRHYQCYHPWRRYH